MSKLFDGNYHSLKIEEGDDLIWPEVSVILPGFAIDSMRNALPPCFQGAVSWETTDIEKIMLFIPTPVQRVGMSNQQVLAAQKAFSTAVDLATKSMERMLELKSFGGSLVDTWILAPDQWMYKLWRFRCSPLDLETLPYDLRRFAARTNCEDITEREAWYAEWMAKEIEKWVEEDSDE